MAPQITPLLVNRLKAFAAEDLAIEKKKRHMNRKWLCLIARKKFGSAGMEKKQTHLFLT